MTSVVTIIVICVVLALIAGPIFFWQVRKTLREQKNFERGLKMVPLLIQLPPSSDDTDSTNRDVRDVVDENVSKAQILYGILSSIFKKGFKNKFYGQRHLSLEIVAVKGSVQFYAAVPIAIVDVVKQAVISAYPSARLEEIEEHNVFSPTGKLEGTVGGEFTLKEHYAYPIATYQDIKRDPIQSMLNSLSTLENDDGAGIQVLLRPAPSDWRGNASAIASSKRKGEKKRKGIDGVVWWIQQLFLAFTKPPEEKSGEGGSDKPNLSAMDQNILDSIDDKTRNPGFETLIRVVASSPSSQKSQAILSNVTASFSLFDAPGKNGFYYTPAKDMESFITSYILRLFPQENNKNILNTVELATLYHFPDQSNIPTSQVERQQSKQVDGPRNMSDEGLLLGYNVFRGAKRPIRLAPEDRARHIYTVGQTGVGKSQFFENLALQDMLDGNGFAFVDPHGDVADNLLSMVPKERTEDIIYFCPSDMDYPMGLNLFEFQTEQQKDFLIQESISMLYKLYDPTRQGIIGPRFERIFTNSALLLMADPNGGTFVDIPKLLIDPAFMKSKLKYTKDKNVLDFWTKEWPNSQRSNDAGEVTSWVVSKFGAFLSNEMMRNIIGQTKSSFNLRDIMDNKKILIVNLSKGKTGDLNSRLLGMIFVMKFQAAAMSRADIPARERTDFSLYVDEFQNFTTDSIATILSEARKYGLNLIVANQFTTQLSEEIRSAVFGNVGTVVSFRIGQDDVESLGRYFQPAFGPDDLLRVPNWNTIVRTLVKGVPTQPFSMATLPPLGTPNPQLGKALRQLTYAKYGRPKSKVEAEIFKRLSVEDNLASDINSPASSTRRMSSSAQPNPFKSSATSLNQSKTGSSFLDEWLAKRKAKPSPHSTPKKPSAASSPSQQPEPTKSAKAGTETAKTTKTAQQKQPGETQEDADKQATKPTTQASKAPPANSSAETDDKSAQDDSKKEAEKKDSGELKIAPHHGKQDVQEDTIFIDKEGNLRQPGE